MESSRLTSWPSVLRFLSVRVDIGVLRIDGVLMDDASLGLRHGEGGVSHGAPCALVPEMRALQNCRLDSDGCGTVAV